MTNSIKQCHTEGELYLPLKRPWDKQQFQIRTTNII